MTFAYRSTVPSRCPARFWVHVDRSGGPDSCWPWTRWCDEDGYGIVSVGPHRYRAHRVAWSLSQGPIALGLLVLHTCDNPPCANPRHLYEGTHSDNQMDTHACRRRPTVAAARAEDAGQLALWGQ